MTRTNADQARLRARWRSYFEQTLLGPDSEVEAATEAAMEMVVQGQGRDAIRAAGIAAARRERSLRHGPSAGTSSPRASAGDWTQSAGRSGSARQAPAGSAAGSAAGWTGGPAGQNGSTRHARPAGQARPTAQPGPAGSAGPNGARASAAASGSAPGRSTRIWPANSAVVGALEKRTESMDGEFFQVWSFRIFRLEGGRTPVEPPIPVEMRGRSIIGQLTKGDVVEIPSGRSGHTRLVKSLRNLSTQSWIEARGRPFRRTRTVRRVVRLLWSIVGAVVALVFLAAIALVAYVLLSGSGSIGW